MKAIATGSAALIAQNISLNELYKHLENRLQASDMRDVSGGLHKLYCLPYTQAARGELL